MHHVDPYKRSFYFINRIAVDVFSGGRRHLAAARFKNEMTKYKYFDQNETF
jgi:hypothetical protein